MKKGLLKTLGLSVCVFALINFMFLSNLLAADPIHIKLATGAEKWLSAGKGYGKFAELVNERSKGKVKVEVYFGGALGNEVTAIRNMLAETVEMSTSSDANLGAFSDALYFMNLPYVFEGAQGLRKALNQQWVRDYVNDILSKKNMRLLMFLDNGGPRNILTNKKQVKVPAEMKGLKFRTTASKVEVAIFESFGALPTPINWAEVYTALDQGTVDGEGLMYTWMYSTKHFEVVKFVCENEYVIGTQNAYIRLDFWNKLPKDIQDLMEKCARDAEAWEGKVDADYVKEAKAAITKAGVKIYTPSEKEMKLWKGSVVPKVWDMFKDKVSPDLLKKLQDAQK
ncbi:MAG: TRAP transporter substrate-binding protein [Pseudomonadota bacterium]